MCPYTKEFSFIKRVFELNIINRLVTSFERILSLSASQIFIRLVVIHIEVYFVSLIKPYDHVSSQVAKILARRIKVGESITSALQRGQIDLISVQFQL